MHFFDGESITVEVEQPRWHAHGPKNFRTKVLCSILRRKGVGLEVPNGEYNFNARLDLRYGIDISLLPKE